MSRPLLIALFALACPVLLPAQEGDPVPRALPVTEEAPVPKALPVEPSPAGEAEKPAPATEGLKPSPRPKKLSGEEVKVPRAIPVLPGDPETLRPEQRAPRAVPAIPTGRNPDATGSDPLAEWNGGDTARQAEALAEKERAPKKPEFEPPPLPKLEKRELPKEKKPTAPIGAAWQTRTEARTLTLRIPAPRGQITDRNGQPLAQNKVGHYLALKLPYFEKATDTAILDYAKGRMRKSAGYLGKDWTLSDDAILSHYNNRRWLPLPFSSTLSAGQMEVIESRMQSGLELFPTYQRYYPERATACHIVGYVGKKAKVPTGPVVSGEPMWAITEGREGLEFTFDSHLQGRPGSINYLFDSNGKKLAEEMVQQPIPGSNVVTAIDLEMQQLAEDCLRRYTKRGALVVMDVQTGDIYAMASRPTYDINTWIPAISTEEFKALQDDPDLPLFPRAFRGQYPPASTFKVSIALAALESGVIDGQTYIDCPTSISIGNETYKNWNKKGEGSLNVVEAIKRSCNTWFYNVGMRTGGENVSSMAHRLGYGSKTGIPLNAEEDGFMPTDAVLREKYGYRFSHGYLAHASIGQGSVLATPLQVAQMMAAIGNGYYVPKPRLVLQVQDLNNNILEAFAPIERNALNLTPKNLGYVRQGMIDVVNASSGTGKSASNDYVTMAGKTGTGEWVQDGVKLYLSWFAGYLPAENPRYAFAAVCEGDPGEYISGGKKSAPLVGEFFNAHYKRLKSRGELGGYARTAVASPSVAVTDADTEGAPEARAVGEGQPVTDNPATRRRGLFGFGRRSRR